MKDELCIRNNDSTTYEKINEIRIYNGNKFKLKEKVFAGEIFAVTGIMNAKIGDGLGNFTGRLNYEMLPALKSKVIFDGKFKCKGNTEIF